MYLNNGTSYTYTANGELTSKNGATGTTAYTYDVLGNLTAVIMPNGTAISYVIDGMNRRIGKKVNGALVKRWLYDGIRHVVELDGAGAVVATFVYASKGNAPDYMVKGGNTYRIISDHLGSPMLVVDSVTGAIVHQMDYDEFGIVANDSNPGFQPFGFAGGLYDSDAKLLRGALNLLHLANVVGGLCSAAFINMGRHRGLPLPMKTILILS